MRPVKEPTAEERVGFWAVLENKAQEIGYGELIYTIVDGQIVKERTSSDKIFTLKKKRAA